MTLQRTPDPASHAVYVWARIDPRHNRLIRDKFMLKTQEARREVEKERKRIFLANRLNVNRTAVDIEILRMWGQKIDAVAAKHYEILCHHWSLLGERKTGAFVRACSAILVRTIEQLGGSEAQKARTVHRRRGGLGQSPEKSYKGCADGIADRWRTTLDIEARERDLAESVEHAKRNQAAAPIRPSVGPGEIVVECGPLSTDIDTAAASIAMLQKLGFGKEQEEWPSSFFGPVLPDVLEQLKRAHQILTAKGFVFGDDPLNPLGDGKSWVLKCEPPIELPDNSDPARLAHLYLKREGIKVATKPVLDGETLLIALWDSGTDSDAEIDRTASSTDGIGPEVPTVSSRELLHFVRRGNEIFVEPCNNLEAAVANTSGTFIPCMRQVKSIVRSHGGKITVAEMRRRFKDTDFVKALDAEDWQTLIDECSQKRSAGLKNMTAALLARRTGLSNDTVRTYMKPGRMRKKIAQD